MIGILLAAGFSRRFGSHNKLIYPLADGRPIALAAAQSLLEALPNSIAVVREGHPALSTLLSEAGLIVEMCPPHAQMMAESLAHAVRCAQKLKGAHEGFVIALADMPYIAPATIRAVATRVQQGVAIVVPTYHGQRGHPVGFSAKFSEALMHVQGDQGARTVIARYSEEVSLLPCADEGILHDIDTPHDLR